MRKSTTEEFIQKARAKHGDKYLYDKTVYVNAITKLIVTCKIHGDFLVGTNKHLERDGGCIPCAIGKTIKRCKKDLNTFLKQAFEVHGDKYLYDEVEYVNTHTKIRIKCRKHGIFEQTPNKHISKQKQGCPKCTVLEDELYVKIRKDSFIKKAMQVHNNFYTYENVSYKGTEVKVCVTCPIHGHFLTGISEHLAGSGCIKCSYLKRHNFSRSSFVKNSKNGKSTMYVIRCFDETEMFIKVGITNRSIDKRFKNKKFMPYSYEVVAEIEGSPEYVWDLEKLNLRLLTKFRFTPKKHFCGITECFCEDALKEIVLEIK